MDEDIPVVVVDEGETALDFQRLVRVGRQSLLRFVCSLVSPCGCLSLVWSISLYILRGVFGHLYYTVVSPTLCSRGRSCTFYSFSTQEQYRRHWRKSNHPSFILQSPIAERV